MHITSQPRNAPTSAPRSAEKTFNYNAQDPDTLESDVVTLDKVTSGEGKVSTESVVLENKKAIFVFGQLVGLRPDGKYRLDPNGDGHFVFPQGHPSFTGANVFGAAAATVDKYNQVLGELTGKSVEWAFGDAQLKVSPETGDWPNAFYARQFKGVHFFDYKHTSTGDSGEVASHEVGHAVLDAIRPGYLQGSGPETGAFHEAFGDILAMLMTLGNDKAVDGIVSQTASGDLSSRRNMLSDMGEGFGNALGLKGGIRTSFNQFVYADPATLPERGDEHNLGREVHDFSRLWSGAFYDILDGISDAYREAGMTPQQALKAAGEEGWRLLVGQMENSPATSETTFKEMAAHLLAGDAQFNDGKRQDLIRNVLTRREMQPENEGIFGLSARNFSGQSVEKTFQLGSDAGPLAGVQMTALVDEPTFGFAPIQSRVLAEAEKGARLMLASDQVLFTETKPEFGDFFKPEGGVYRAYVMPNEQGVREFHRVPMAFCDFGNGPDSVHEHGHGHCHSNGHCH